MISSLNKKGKAYDSVQAYTIKASLFISYVLSNLEDATSCFKTLYGPTEEFTISRIQYDKVTLFHRLSIFSLLTYYMKASNGIQSSTVKRVTLFPSVLI